MSSGGSEGLVQGFAIVPGVLDRGVIDALPAAIANASHRTRAGVRHLMSHPAVRQLAHDPRLKAIARQYLAADPVPFRATLFDKSSNNNWLVVWHQDTALPLQKRRDVSGWGPWSIKAGVSYAHAPARALARIVALRLHIDDSRGDNGPLRVLPGTHTLGVLTDRHLERLARDTSPVECIVPSGGVVAMRPLIVHSSTKAHADFPRRVLHIEYADSVSIDGLELAIA